MNDANKTLEQLTTEAAEAQKTIDALAAKKAELEKQKREAEQVTQEKLAHAKSTVATLAIIKEFGPQLKKLVITLNTPVCNGWESQSVWDKHEHGDENEDEIITAEATYGFIRYRVKIGNKTVLLIASPLRNMASLGSYYSRYKVYGAVQMVISGGYKTDKTATYKSFDNAPKKIQAAIDELVSSQKQVAVAKDAKKTKLDNIITAAQHRFPKAEKIEASYEYTRNNYGNSRGYQESSNVTLTVKMIEKDYNTHSTYKNVVLDGSSLSATFMRREEIK